MYQRPIKHNFPLLCPSGHDNSWSTTRSIHGLRDYLSSLIFLLMLATTAGMLFWMINKYHPYHSYRYHLNLLIVHCLWCMREKQFSSPFACFSTIRLPAISCFLLSYQLYRIHFSIFVLEGGKQFPLRPASVSVFFFRLTFVHVVVFILTWHLRDSCGVDSSVPPIPIPIPMQNIVDIKVFDTLYG